MKSIKYKRKKQEFYIAEAYKTLRTNINFCGEDVKTITITSCLPNDGKSETALNIALNMADDGKRVLLIDVDLRKSELVKKMGVRDPELKGLSHYLSGQASLNDIMYYCGNEFYTIFAGSFPPNPAELLGSKKFKLLLEAVRDKFDYVILDSAPLASVIDSAIISAITDGTILVISQGSTSYKLAQEVKAQLEKSNCRILGVVLNKVRINSEKGYYNNYAYKYAYSDKKSKP